MQAGKRFLTRRSTGPYAIRAALLALSVTMAACGVRTSPLSPSPSPSSAAVPPIVSGSIVGTVAAFQVSRHGWTAPSAGTVLVTLAWSDASVDLDLYAAGADCSTLYPQRACGVLASARSATGTSETVTATVQAGQALALFVDNLDVSRPEEYTLTLDVR